MDEKADLKKSINKKLTAVLTKPRLALLFLCEDAHSLTIIVSLIFGEGSYSPCVPGLTERLGSEIAAVIVQTISSAILGAGFSGCYFLGEKDEWSLLKRTGIYFGIVAVLMMAVAYICESMEPSVKGILGYFGIFVLIFVVVWAIQYFIWKARISKIKEELQKKN